MQGVDSVCEGPAQTLQKFRRPCGRTGVRRPYHRPVDRGTDLGFGMAGSPILSERSPLKSRTMGESQLVPVSLAKRPRAIDSSQGEVLVS